MPLQLMSSIHSSLISGSSGPMPIVSRIAMYFRLSSSACVIRSLPPVLPAAVFDPNGSFRKPASPAATAASGGGPLAALPRSVTSQLSSMARRMTSVFCSGDVASASSSTKSEQAIFDVLDEVR